MQLRRTHIVLRPDSSRVLLRAFYPTTEQRALKIVARVAALSEQQVAVELETVRSRFENRHRQLQTFFLRRFEQIKALLLTDSVITPQRQLLLGAYFTQEYALEGAALFNPSLVWHPDQSGVPEGSKRFILSLRATGEGHISSITFRRRRRTP